MSQGQSAVRTDQRPTAPPQKKPTLSLTQDQTRLGWMLLAPTLLLTAFVAFWPLLQTIYYSFTNARLLGTVETRFIGLQNYADLLRDSFFHDSIFTTLQFALITVVCEFFLGLGIALVVNSSFKGRGLMRTAMLIPWAIPTVISAQMWAWMFNDVYGVINDLLVDKLGVMDSYRAFLAEPVVSLFAIAAVDIWKTSPFVALLLLAGLQVIPSDVYEAARVDGATGVQAFFRITLPLLRPAIAVALIFRTLDALRVFDVFYVIFGARPDTQTMAIYNQQTIVSFANIGYGATISVAIFVIIGIFVAAYVTTLGIQEDA